MLQFFFGGVFVEYCEPRAVEAGQALLRAHPEEAILSLGDGVHPGGWKIRSRVPGLAHVFPHRRGCHSQPDRTNQQQRQSEQLPKSDAAANIVRSHLCLSCYTGMPEFKLSRVLTFWGDPSAVQK